MSAELKSDRKQPELQIVDRKSVNPSPLREVEPHPIATNIDSLAGRGKLPTSGDIFIGQSCPVDFTYPREEVIALREKLLGRVNRTDNEAVEEDLSPYASQKEDAPSPHLVKQMTDIYFASYKVFIDRVARTGVTYDRADDLVNDMYINAHRGLNSYKNKNAMRAWMSRILTNIAIDAARRRQRIWMIDGEDGDNHMRSVSDDEMSHDERMLQNEKREIFYESLNRLSPRDRKALELFYFEGLSCDAAGEILGLTRSATKSVLFRAREQLRDDPKLAELKDRS